MPARGSPRLVVVSGLPGTGKSSLAAGIAGEVVAMHLSVDVIEEALLKAGCPSGWATGVAAYEVAGSVAEANLAVGNSVIVDAVNDSEAARATWRRAAARPGARVLFVVTVCSDPSEHRRRLEARTHCFSWLPEPTWEDVVRRGEGFEPWSDPHVVIDTSGKREASLADALQALTRHE